MNADACWCEARGDVRWAGRLYCGFCALLCVGDFPADRHAEQAKAFAEIGIGARFVGIVDGRVVMNQVPASDRTKVAA